MTTPTHERLNDVLAAVLFLVLAPLVAHLLFSWIGFNPTDDGFILAYSRRVLGGQMPHRDFISIRPVGSAVLHAPALLLGGDRAFWLSRGFVWFQFAVIAWVWVGMLAKALAWPLGRAARVVLALVAFVLSAHSFPMMAWHTTDGLFLCSLGLALCLREGRGARMAGCVLVGLACLCKQNFAAMVPVALVATGEWRRVTSWLAAAAPAVAYVCILLLGNALPDAWVQMRSQTGLFRAGVRPYVGAIPFPAGVALGAAIAAALASRAVEARRLGVLALYAAPAGFIAMVAAGYHFEAPALGLMGVAVGATGWQLEGGRAALRRLAVPVALLCLAWVASVSLGYNSPVLVAGPLGVLLVGYAETVPGGGEDGTLRRLRVLGTVALAVAAVCSGWVLRRERVYLDRPARELTKPLGGVLPGLRGIHTSFATRAALDDLAAVVEQIGERPYAIVPDFPAWWVCSGRPNPLPIDWAQGTELASPRAMARVLESIERQRGTLVVIVQKFDARFLELGLDPLPKTYRFHVAQHVRRRMRKTGETRFFEVYE